MKPQKRSIPKELLVIGLACLAAYAMSVYFNLSEYLHILVHTYEKYQFDELLIIFVILTIGFSIFSFRRYTDLKNEMAERLSVQRDKDVFEKIVMSATDAMTFVDRNYRFKAVNDTMVKVWGRQNQEDFIGHHIKDFVGETLFNDSIKAVYDKCFAGEQVIIQQWYNFEGFSRRFLYFIYNPYFEKDGTVSGAVVVATNLTELKETDEALSRSEIKFKKLFNLSNTPTMLIRIGDNAIVDVNDRYGQDYGYSRDETIGKNFLETERCLSPEGMDHVVKELLDTGNIDNREARIITKKGNPLNVLLSASIIELEQQPYILISTQDITSLKAAEKKITDALREKEVLLKEIHHRVKNNMAVISSLLNLQSRYVDDEKYLTMFRESRNRIISMALVHEQLYRTEDFGHIDVQDYIGALIENIRNTHVTDHRVSVEAHVDNIYMEIDNLVPLGIIMNEILTNAFKHAFAETKEPVISLSMKKAADDQVVLTISDNGSGLPEGFDISQCKSLGLHLVSILSSQINGRMEMTSDNGIVFKIVFPEKMNLARHLTKDG